MSKITEDKNSSLAEEESVSLESLNESSKEIEKDETPKALQHMFKKEQEI